MIDARWLVARKHYWWWVPDITKLDEEAIVEGVLNYGRWNEFLELKEMLGIKRMSELFYYMSKTKNRVNLRPEKIVLFDHYFAKHAAH